MIEISLYGKSDIGQIRRVNEDSFRLIPDCRAVVVCDGMGGHAAGEVASQCAVETVESYLMREDLRGVGAPDWNNSELPEELDDLIWAVRLANRRVFMVAQSQQQMAGMGTTLVAARFVDGAVCICHVGDSRAYRFRDNKLAPITVDHSLVAELVARNEITAEQAETFADRNIITRALGTRPAVAVDVNVFPAVAGEWILFCSDGLSGVIGDQEMGNILTDSNGDPQKAIDALIKAANEIGGPDNITVAIAVIRDAGESTSTTEASVTIPESTEDVGDAESAYLKKMFPQDGTLSDSDLSEARTDRIPINLAQQDRRQ